MKFKKNVISNLVYHAITIIIGFFTSILIARGLGTSNQGQLSFYILIFGLIASFITNVTAPAQPKSRTVTGFLSYV